MGKSVMVTTLCPNCKKHRVILKTVKNGRLKIAVRPKVGPIWLPRRCYRFFFVVSGAALTVGQLTINLSRKM
jgi:hypothetical protein